MHNPRPLSRQRPNPRRQPGQRLHQTPKPPRWWLFGVPLLFLVAAWLAQGVHPAIEWGEVMTTLRVKDKDSYTKLATLGVLICSGLALGRVVRKSDRDSRSD